MAIRKGDWKLVKTREGPLVDVDPSTLRDLSDASLYHNLSEEHIQQAHLGADFDFLRHGRCAASDSHVTECMLDRGLARAG